MNEHAYMVYAGRAEEGAVVAFASVASEAKKLAFPVIRGWCDEAKWTDIRALRLAGDCAHLRAQEGPHVNDNPPSCERCERWWAEPLVDGVCEACRDEQEADHG